MIFPHRHLDDILEGQRISHVLMQRRQFGLGGSTLERIAPVGHQKIDGYQGPVFFLSKIRHFLLAHPTFKLSDANTNKQTTVNPLP